MSKRLQNTEMNTRLPRVMLGAAALLVMLSATSVAPAFAQGAPDQLRYLDPPKSSATDAQAQLTTDAKARSAYARVSIKKHQVQH